MGNAEGGQNRSSSHSNSPQHSAATLKSDKTKRHQRHKSANAVHELHVDGNNESYYTCKTSLGGRSQQAAAEAPATYFYQLPTSQVNRVHSKTLAAPLVREGATNTAANLKPFESQRSKELKAVPSSLTEVDRPDKDTDDIDSAYLTASTGFKTEMQALRPQMSTLTKADLIGRIERFNLNSHELRMDVDKITGTVSGFIRVRMHILSPISMRLSKPNSMYDVVSRDAKADAEEDVDVGVQTTKFCVPLDATKLVNVTSKSRTTDVIQLLLSKFHIVDSSDRFALYERDVELKSVRKLSVDEVPLMLSLSWSDEGPKVFDRKQFVLKETHVDKPQWEAFSIPELNNFLSFMQREEDEQVELIRGRYAELRQNYITRLTSLASLNDK